MNLPDDVLELLAWDISDAFNKDVDRHGLDFGLEEIRVALPAFIDAIRANSTETEPPGQVISGTNPPAPDLVQTGVDVMLASRAAAASSSPSRRESLNIYRLERTDTEVARDELLAAVVIADDESHARELTAREAKDEGDGVWVTSRVTVMLLGTALPGTAAGVVLTDVLEG